MQKEEMKIELTINGQKVKVGHRFLESVCRDIPDIKENTKIFNILAKLEISHQSFHSFHK